MEYSQLAKLISDSNDIVDFGDKSTSVGIEGILRVENELGFTLPPSYKWWVLNYGVGEIYGDEVYGIYYKDESLNTVPSGDIVFKYRNNLRNGIIKPYMIPIMNADSLYYMNIEEMSSNGEYLIYRLHDDVVYSNSFAGFLEKQIKMDWL